MYIRQEDGFDESYEKLMKIINHFNEDNIASLSKTDFKKMAFLKKTISILSSIESDQGMDMVVDFLEIFDKYN